MSMDPITAAIIAALVGHASPENGGPSTDPVAEAYAVLKQALIAHIGSRFPIAAALAAVERDPSSPAGREQLPRTARGRADTPAGRDGGGRIAGAR